MAIFRNAALFGYVTFNQENNRNLEILINRDRLDSESSAFKELRKFVRLGIDFATVIYSSEIETEKEGKENLQKAKLEEIKKQDAERQRIAEEERKKAIESASRIEEEKKRAQEEESLARVERQKAERERIKAEEERRQAELLRRTAEENARKKQVREEWEKAEQAHRLELEKIKLENNLRKIEDERRNQEIEAIKKAEEKRELASAAAVTSFETYKKVEEENISIQKAELTREADKYRQEFSRLRVLASTGTLIFIFTHEIQALIDDMKLLAHRLTEIIQKSPLPEQQKYLETLKIFDERIEMIKDFRHFLGLSIGQESLSEMKKWLIKPIIDEIESPFKLQLRDRGIQFTNSIPEMIRTPSMYKSELIAIIHNLLSNSIKAVTNTNDRRIEVTAFEINEVLIIRVLDSGRGLKNELWDKVFEPFISYSEPDLVYGAGTGLGLKIVKDIIKAYEGDIHFIPPPVGWSTCVEIKLPLVRNDH